MDFENSLAIYRQRLEKYGYAWLAKGRKAAENLLFVQAVAKKKPPLTGLGMTWSKCFEDIISQLESKK